MKINELIAELEAIKEREGNIIIKVRDRNNIHKAIETFQVQPYMDGHNKPFVYVG